MKSYSNAYTTDENTLDGMSNTRAGTAAKIALHDAISRFSIT